MTTQTKVLFLEDDPYDKELVSQILKRGGLNCALTHAADGQAFQEALSNDVFDLILSDFSVPGITGFEACERAKSLAPGTPFILLSGTLSEEQAVEIIKKGAVDYVIKERLFRLVPAIIRAIAEAEQIRAKQKAESLLAAQSEFLRSLVDTAAAAIIAVTPSGTVVEWNPEAERIFDWPRSAAIGKNYLDTFLKPENREGPATELAKVVSGTPVRNYDSKILTRTGDERIICWNASRLERNPPLILAVGIDVTEERQQQEELYRSQRLDTLGSLAAGIAHDLNNVLAPIMMGVGLLRKSASPEEEKILGILQDSGERASEMVSQILSFGKGTSIVSKVQLGTIIKAMVKFARQTFPENIKVEAKLDSKLSPVLGNPTEIHQVLLNLCVNARDAMPEGGVLTIIGQNLRGSKTSRLHKSISTDRQVLLAVQDTGMGIPPDILPKIFEPFFTTKHEAGTGLGLATATNIVRSHNGVIEVESLPGTGTTFKIFLPAAASGDLEEIKIEEAPEDLQGQGEVILCVDNEIAVLEMIKETLASYGYKPMTYSSGVLAFAAVQAGAKPDLLLTDLRVPMMNGEAIIRLMRTFFPDLKCVLMSGSGAVEQKLLDDLDLSAFMKKPFSSVDLLRAIKSSLQAPAPLKT